VTLKRWKGNKIIRYDFDDPQAGKEVWTDKLPLTVRSHVQWKAEALVNPAYTSLFQFFRYTDVGKHLTVYKVREREASYSITASRENGLKSQTSFLIMIHMCESLRRMGLKTSLRGSRIPEKLNTRPNRTLLEGEKTGRKCRGCVWQGENSVRQ